MDKILATLTILATALLGMLSPHAVRKLGGVEPVSNQADSEANAVSMAKTYQDDQKATTGKYKHIPETSYDAPTPSTYEVNEFLYPDGTRGYQVITSHYEDVTTATGTQKTLKQDSVGVGKEAKNLTWTK